MKTEWATNGYGAISDPAGSIWEARRGRHQEADALEAVRKLNSHADLLEACKLLMAQVARLAEVAFSAEHEHFLTKCDAMNAGKRALKKAGVE